MKIGVAIPTDYRELEKTANAVEALIEQAKQLAAAGVNAVWLTQRFDYDATTVAALIAREVPDIEIGTAVVPIYPRHPIALSMQAQTAQAVSHGRFTLGLGMSMESLVTVVRDGEAPADPPSPGVPDSPEPTPGDREGGPDR
jgi:alkanesulfonate monooxygenase SsuD/methylene tetrahydromethanopterin reductase-like flavin-dependent oxidoreductase (luciferase family)